MRRGWGGLQWRTGGGLQWRTRGGLQWKTRGGLQWRTKDGDCSEGPGVGLGGMAVEDQGEDCNGGLEAYCSGGGLSGGLQ